MKNYEVKYVSREVFDIFLDVCYKRKITVNMENYQEVRQFADFYQCDLLLRTLWKGTLTP